MRACFWAQEIVWDYPYEGVRGTGDGRGDGARGLGRRPRATHGFHQVQTFSWSILGPSSTTLSLEESQPLALPSYFIEA